MAPEVPRHEPDDPRLGRTAMARGESARKTLLIHVEQLRQFVPLLPLTAAAQPPRRLRVIIEAPTPLVRLFRSVKDIDQVITRGEPLPHFDFRCAMLSLPAMIGTAMETIPAEVLICEPTRAGHVVANAAQWSGLASTRSGWYGGAVSLKCQRTGRSADDVPDPACWRRSLRWPASISSASRKKARTHRRFPLMDFMGGMIDFADAAALIEHLDLIISIDTSSSACAGTLGKPVWLMDRSIPCWRSLIERQDGPWSPTLRLSHRPSPTDSRFSRSEVARDLRNYVGARPNNSPDRRLSNLGYFAPPIT